MSFITEKREQLNTERTQFLAKRAHQLAGVKEKSTASRAINTSFVERQNGTDRHRKARKARKTYRLSKAWRYHEAFACLIMCVYNFCWPVRTLGIKEDERTLQK